MSARSISLDTADGYGSLKRRTRGRRELGREAIRDPWCLVIGNASDDLSTSPRLVRFFFLRCYPELSQG
jgi:hypothetical protein